MPTTPPRLPTLILLTALSVLTLNMFMPALPGMAQEFGVDAPAMALAVSGYMLVSALLQIIMGPLSDRFGRRPVLLGAMGLYAAASVGTVLASDLGLFLACRVVQASVVAGIVVTNAVIRDVWPAEEAASRMGTISAAMAVAPMLGPMLGGGLEQVAGWRSIFLFYAVAGGLALVLVWLDVGETNRNRGARLSTQVAAWKALARSAEYWGFVLCAAFAVGTFFIFISGAPFVSAAVFGLSPMMLGVGIGSITGGFMMGATITARRAARVGLRPLIMAGRGIALAGLTLGLFAFAAGLGHPLVFFGAAISVGFGNGLTMANANAGALSVRPDVAGAAAGLSGALAMVVGAGLTSGTALVLQVSADPAVLLGLMWISVALSLGFAVVAFRFGAAAHPS